MRGTAVEGGQTFNVLPTDKIVAEAELGCEKSSGAKGKGKIEDKTIGATASFSTFSFVGLTTEVNFTIGEPVPAGVTALGHASFAADKPGVEACFVPGPGPSELSFDAKVSGIIG